MVWAAKRIINTLRKAQDTALDLKLVILTSSFYLLTPTIRRPISARAEAVAEIPPRRHPADPSAWLAHSQQLRLTNEVLAARRSATKDITN